MISRGTQLVNGNMGILALLPSKVWTLSIAHSEEYINCFPESFSLDMVLKIFCVEVDELLAIQNVWLFGVAHSFQKGTGELRFYSPTIST